MRFDDSLETVLTADMSTPFGAQTAWRQLVDLIGRGRAPASAAALTRLRSIRAQVPSSIRAASARALAFARPPAALVRLFAEEDLAIAAPVLRMAELTTEEWIAILPDMSPAGRSVLRHRRDLAAEVGRALESYGPIDFILPAGPVAPVNASTVDDTPASDALQDAAPAAAPTHVAEAEAVLDEATSEHAVPVDEPVPPAEACELAEAPDACVADPIGTADLSTIADVADAIVEPDPAPLMIEAALSTEQPALDAPAALPVMAPPVTANALSETPLAIDWTEVLRARPPLPVERVVNTPAPAIPVAAGVPPIDVAASDIVQAPVEQPFEPLIAVEPVADQTPIPPPSSLPDESAFVSLASVAFGLPVMVEAMRQQGSPAPQALPVASEVPAPDASAPKGAAEAQASDAPRGPYQISDLVARIEAFNRQREEEGRTDAPAPIANDIAPAAAVEGFQFETDAGGVIRWVSGVSRSAIVGMSLHLAASGSDFGVDGVAAGAFRSRASFANARLSVAGASDAAGQWRISGIPAFDPASGRFTGYRGTARRPRMDERAELGHRSPASDSLRQLVHELRTPTTAIAGFAEMIESELLGPVSPAYRGYAGTIRQQASGLLGAIDDLDTAARIESHALDLRPVEVPLSPMLAEIVADLEPLAALRGAAIRIDGDGTDKIVRGDDRALQRLIGRLLAALVATTANGETLRIAITAEGDETIALGIVRPSGLAVYADDALLAIDAETEAEAAGAPLLGTGFALRLARNLAAELGGSLSIGADRLTLRLPAAFTHSVGQASTF